MKARPIISFFRTWEAPLLTVFGALIFELTKITFPHIPGQTSQQQISIQKILQIQPHLSSSSFHRFLDVAIQDSQNKTDTMPTSMSISSPWSSAMPCPMRPTQTRTFSLPMLGPLRLMVYTAACGENSAVLCVLYGLISFIIMLTLIPCRISLSLFRSVRV